MSHNSETGYFPWVL